MLNSVLIHLDMVLLGTKTECKVIKPQASQP